MDKRYLNAKQEAIWTALQLLENDTSMNKGQLMDHTGIKEDRHFYEIVREMRKAGYLIGSSKKGGLKGYYEIRNENQLKETICTFQAMVKDYTSTAQAIEQAFKNQDQKTLGV